jgi:pimeloyl-ACP methyl ester carboxylesterase
MNGYADDLAVLIETLDLKEAILVGHSTVGGEFARCILGHGTKRVGATAQIVASCLFDRTFASERLQFQCTMPGALGDNAAIEDLSINVPGVRTVPNAQHAVRQGKLLAANIVATLRGKPTRNFNHKSLGVVAALGIGQGVFQSGRRVITRFPAWTMHSSYHVFAIPTWERKIRVLAVWLTGLIFGRDIASLESAG